MARAHRHLVMNEKSLMLHRERNTLGDVERAIILDPGNSEYHRLMAEIYRIEVWNKRLHGRIYWEEALSHYIRAAQLNPWYRDYRKGIIAACEYLISRPDVNEARRAKLKAILEKYPLEKPHPVTFS